MLTKLSRPLANNNEQQQNTTRVWHEPNHNKQEHDAILTRTNTFNHQKKTPMREHNLQTPRVVSEKHNKSLSEKSFEELLPQEDKVIVCIDAQTNKNAMTQETLRKKMTTQPSHAYHNDKKTRGNHDIQKI